jgi:peptide methionine sulfoxide reductase MsrB
LPECALETTVAKDYCINGNVLKFVPDTAVE